MRTPHATPRQFQPISPRRRHGGCTAPSRSRLVWSCCWCSCTSATRGAVRARLQCHRARPRRCATAAPRLPAIKQLFCVMLNSYRHSIRELNSNIRDPSVDEILIEASLDHFCLCSLLVSLDSVFALHSA
jgi:hypothetical protein